MDRREFFRWGAAIGAGAVFSRRSGAGISQGGMLLPESPAFETRHLVTIILGNGARKTDVIDDPERCPFQARMAKLGTLFTDDFGETANLHGYMYSEVLTGRDAPSQRPLYPTWNEYVRKKTGAKASDFWMLQGASIYRGFSWDVKHYSQHPDYGIGTGATSLTMNKLFSEALRRSPRDLVEANVEAGLGHSRRERQRIEEWLADVSKTRAYEFPSTRQPVIDREPQVGDCQALHLAGRILKDFQPRMITVQVLGLDDAHADFGFWDDETSYDFYLRHLETTDELIGNLWAQIQSDPYLRRRTSLLIRPECGRDDEVDRYGQLGHSPGNPSAHSVWTSALGPDFPSGRVVRERVERRDLAPTITYLMSGQGAEYSTGHVRTQMFRDEHRMPGYVLPDTGALRPVVH